MSKTKTVLYSLIVMALWGSLFPCVKIGYEAFAIDSSRIPDIIMFAAIRFTLCGALVCIYCLLNRKKTSIPSKRSVINFVWIGVFAIVLHYACTYIGLSLTDSSKTALLKQSGVLLYVCFAFLFFKDERFSIFKLIGAVVGFCGIIAINLGSGGISFSVGDILILGASFCTVASNVITRYTAGNDSPLWVTGISQLSGGIVLLAGAIIMGGTIPQINFKAILVFVYICTASVTSYTLWYYVLKHAELSKMFIIKFAEPLFACIFGALLLGENILKLQYLAAFVLICLGITLGNYTPKKQVE